MSLGLFEYGGGPSTELKPVTIMQQGFYVLRFHLYQQKYQQYAKVPHDWWSKGCLQSWGYLLSYSLLTAKDDVITMTPQQDCNKFY